MSPEEIKQIQEEYFRGRYITLLEKMWAARRRASCESVRTSLSSLLKSEPIPCVSKAEARRLMTSGNKVIIK